MIPRKHWKLTWQKMHSFFAYPFRGNGKFVCAVGAALMLVARILAAKSIESLQAFGMGGSLPALKGLLYAAGSVCIYGYVSLLVMSVMSHVARGEAELPDWPDVRSWTEMARGAFVLGGTLLMSFAPLLVYHLATDRNDVWFWVLACLGAFYGPMAVLSVAIRDDLSGVNPITVVCSIARTFPSYLALLWIIPSIWALDRLAGRNWAVSVLAAAITTYCLLLGGLQLGLFCKKNAKRLKWWPET